MRSRACLLSVVVAATVLIPGPATAQEASPATGTDPAIIVGTTRSGVARLVRIPLDGRNVPQVLAERPTGGGLEAPGWSVSPDGRTALFVTGQGTVVSLIDLPTGAARDVEMASRIDGYDLLPVWSADSAHVAIADRGWSVIEIAPGTRTHLRSGDDAHGFDASGRLILEHKVEETRGEATWTFQRWDPATPTKDPIAIPIEEAAVPLAAPGEISVSLRAVVGEVHPIDGRPGLGLRSLVDGTAGRFAGLPSQWGNALFDPSGRIAVAKVNERLYLATAHLMSTPILALDEGDDRYVDLRDIRFSPGSGLLAFQRGFNDPVAVVHEVGTGRTVFVPLPTDVATSRLVAITGSGPLSLRPVAPPAAWVRPAEVTTGRVIAGSPLVVSWRIDRPVGEPAQFSVAFGRPASSGVVRTLDTHDFPIAPGAEDAPIETDIVAGPGPDTITVTTGFAQDRRAWTWRRGDRPHSLPIPNPFRRAIGLVWSPDGTTLAGRLRYTDAMVAIWRPATGTERFLVVPVRFQGGWVEGFTADGRAVIVSPGQCTDECSPEPPNHFLALPIDSSGPVRVQPDGWYPWDSEGRRLELRRFWDKPGQVTVQLPRGLTTATSYSAQATTDDRSLWVFAARGADRLLLRYDRPWTGVRAPARLALPDEVQSIDEPARGWLEVSGEPTLGCRARQGLARPGAGIHWVGACREIAFTLP